MVERPALPSASPGGAHCSGTRRSRHENWSPVLVARRRVAADQIVPLGGIDRAADARRRRPDHLCIMGNILPAARPADAWKQVASRLKQQALPAPQSDELLG